MCSLRWAELLHLIDRLGHGVMFFGVLRIPAIVCGFLLHYTSNSFGCPRARSLAYFAVASEQRARWIISGSARGSGGGTDEAKAVVLGHSVQKGSGARHD